MPYLLSLLLLTFTISAYGADDKGLQQLQPLTPESEHPKLYREVFDRLATEHYRSKNINDDLSKEYSLFLY